MILKFNCLIFSLLILGCSREQNAYKEPNNEKTFERSNTLEAWNDQNDPKKLLDSEFVTEFKSMAKSGVSQSPTWTDFYWPDNRGGAAYRWRSKKNAFDYEVLDSEAFSELSKEQQNKLSPLEKYDVFMGRLDFPTVNKVKGTASRSANDWEGLCDAVSAIGMTLLEPRSVTLKSDQGVEVEFGSSDVKALLAHYYGRVFSYQYKMAGEACSLERPDDSISQCRDVNAGSFHIILTNLLGKQGRPFIADMTKGLTAWNHIVNGFVTREKGDVPLPKGHSSWAVKAIQVSTTIDYLGPGAPSIEKPSQDNVKRRLTLEYILEIDISGKVVGGHWTTAEHPDFVWLPQIFRPRGYWESLSNIYNTSVGENQNVFGIEPVVLSPLLMGFEEFFTGKPK